MLREKSREAGDAGDSNLNAWSALVVRIGGIHFVIAQDDIEEILTQDKLTQVRGVAPWFVGVGFFQGKLLNVIDGQRLLGTESQQDRMLLAAVRILVIPGDKEWFGLKVDELMGIRHVWADYAGPPKQTEKGDWINYVEHWIEIKEQLMPVLNVKKMASVLERSDVSETV